MHHVKQGDIVGGYQCVSQYSARGAVDESGHGDQVSDPKCTRNRGFQGNDTVTDRQKHGQSGGQVSECYEASRSQNCMYTILVTLPSRQIMGAKESFAFVNYFRDTIASEVPTVDKSQAVGVSSRRYPTLIPEKP